MGGRSYDAFAEVWPTMDYFAGWNAMPKYVVSTTVTDPQWDNTTVISFDDVAGLKETEGGPIFVQGSMLLDPGPAQGRTRRRDAADGLPGGPRQRPRPVPRRRRRQGQARRSSTSTTYTNGVQYQVLRTVR